jgi:hypothetical protein
MLACADRPGRAAGTAGGSPQDASARSPARLGERHHLTFEGDGLPAERDLLLANAREIGLRMRGDEGRNPCPAHRLSGVDRLCNRPGGSSSDGIRSRRVWQAISARGQVDVDLMRHCHRPHFLTVPFQLDQPVLCQLLECSLHVWLRALRQSGQFGHRGWLCLIDDPQEVQVALGRKNPEQNHSFG